VGVAIKRFPRATTATKTVTASAVVDETFAPTVKQEPPVGMMTIAPMAGACMTFAGLGFMVVLARGILTATVAGVMMGVALTSLPMGEDATKTVTATVAGVTGFANPSLTGAAAATKTVIVSPIIVMVSGTGYVDK